MINNKKEYNKGYACDALSKLSSRVVRGDLMVLLACTLNLLHRTARTSYATAHRLTKTRYSLPSTLDQIHWHDLFQVVSVLIAPCAGHALQRIVVDKGKNLRDDDDDVLLLLMTLYRVRHSPLNRHQALLQPEPSFLHHRGSCIRNDGRSHSRS